MLGVAHPDDPDAGRAGPQPRDPGGSRGAQPAAARRRPPRRAAPRRAARRAARSARATARTSISERTSDAARSVTPHDARRAPAVTSRFVVLTGLSGSGKSQAIRALEDLGYFCVDNLPIALLPMLAELTLRAGSEIARAAVVVDVREGQDARRVPARLPQAEERCANLQPGADLPRGGRARRWSAGSARRGGRIRSRRTARRSRASARSASACGRSAGWPITSSTRRR